MGGTEEYYETYKALDTSNKPEFLHFIYTSGNYKFYDAYITVWICYEIYKDQCINNNSTKCIYDNKSKTCFPKILCDKIEKPSKSSCENAVTNTPSLTKCIYEDSHEELNIQNCTIKKLCVNSLTEE